MVWKQCLMIFLVVGLAGLAGCENPDFVCVKQMPIIREIHDADGSVTYLPQGETIIGTSKEACGINENGSLQNSV